MAISISQVAVLSTHQGALRALGYGSVEQFVGAGNAAPLPLAQYLGLNVSGLSGLLAAAQAQLPAAAPTAAPPLRVHRLGLRLDRIPSRHYFAMAVPAAMAQALPASVDLISQMRPVRDQGDRGTCVAHATLAAVEHYWGTQGQAVDLSRQFAYWNCKQHDGDPNGEGTWIAVAMPLLQSDGCPEEALWPYVMTEIPGNESQGPAPAAAQAGAASFRIPAFKQIAPTAVHDIKAALAGQRPVAFSIPVFDSWYLNTAVQTSGDIVNPIPGEPVNSGHAMCMVGYQDDASDPALGGGRFLIRNSWNGSWATHPSTGNVGYGTIPYSYIARFGMEAFSVT